jgi:hypothetical protein
MKARMAATALAVAATCQMLTSTLNLSPLGTPVRSPRGDRVRGFLHSRAAASTPHRS